MKRKRLLAGLVAAALLLLVGCGSGARNGAATNDDSLQKVLDAGELVLGLDVSFPPLGFADENGKGTQFDPTFADAMLQIMDAGDRSHET